MLPCTVSVDERLICRRLRNWVGMAGKATFDQDFLELIIFCTLGLKDEGISKEIADQLLATWSSSMQGEPFFQVAEEDGGVYRFLDPPRHGDFCFKCDANVQHKPKVGINGETYCLPCGEVVTEYLKQQREKVGPA